MCHSRGFVCTPAPATAISIALHLDHYIHILLAKVIHCPLTDIFKVRATGCNHVNHSEDFLVLVFMRMIVVMSVIMAMAVAMVVIMMAVAVAVAVIVRIITAAMARVVMSMAMT